MLALFHKLTHWPPRFVLRRQFEQIFRFVPSETGRIRKLEEDAVAERLRQLALAFDLLCQEEDNVYATANRFGEGRNPLGVRRQILELRPRLEAAKSEFWRAHGLAQVFGFKVEERAEAHLRFVDASRRLTEHDPELFQPLPRS